MDHMPYGGTKDSGLGREGVRYAIEEMTEIKLLVPLGEYFITRIMSAQKNIKIMSQESNLRKAVEEEIPLQLAGAITLSVSI
jgi:Aldehyde dehydrogenase family